jgi:aconitate hydratase
VVNTVNSRCVYLINNEVIIEDNDGLKLNEINGLLKKTGNNEISQEQLKRDEFKKGTISYKILRDHSISGDEKILRIKFDSIVSHDITYVGIIQTARASGLKEFPIPYVLTNCHNSLCAVGGTINEDDHLFGLSAARKYGGIFVPPHLAVIHQYMREMMSACGNMILGSDSHTRYGALGTMSVGEGGPEIVKQLLNRTYDIAYPGIVGIYLTGVPRAGVGPMDVALAIIGEVFEKGYVKNRVMEFVGPGVKSLSTEYRIGVDVMTTETTCLSSIWTTDDTVKEYFNIHGRPEAYKALLPDKIARYDGFVTVDLGRIEPMIAMPFHPSHVYTVNEANKNAKDILNKIEKDARKLIGEKKEKLNLENMVIDNRIHVDQGLVVGCSGGTYENLMAVADIIKSKSIGNGDFTMSVYPASQPIYIELVKNGAIAKIIKSGSIVRSAFCGPCFGAGDTPANGALSIRHATRNFPNRDGSKPGEGQISYVALMDARSIAATAANGGLLTAATNIEFTEPAYDYNFENKIYMNRVYYGFGRADSERELKFGPNIVDWPVMSAMTENLLVKVVSLIDDPVTTTDELIPSGETSSFRSNPLRLAEYALSRKDPGYVERAKEIQKLEKSRINSLKGSGAEDVTKLLNDLFLDTDKNKIGIGSVIVVKKPGDGSAREQAASCQRVLGGWANIAIDYATKRYRSNVINWGMIPFIIDDKYFELLELNDYIYIRGIKDILQSEREEISATLIRGKDKSELTLRLPLLSRSERKIILAGCLINDYKISSCGTK